MTGSTVSGTYGSTGVAGPPAQKGMPNDPFGDQFRVEQLMMKRDCIEFFFGVEMGNRYAVKPLNKEMTQMYITETSTCFCKVCCGASRAAAFDVFYGGDYDGRNGRKDPKILQLEKPWVCPCCDFCCIGCTAFQRPKMTVKWTDDAFGGSRSAGHVQDHCQCCGFREELHTAKGEHAYTVRGSCWQAGMCCPCYDATLDVVDRKGEGERVVGNVTKRAGDCGQAAKEAFLDLQNFDVKAPEDATPDEKALLVATALMLDLQYFENQNR
mmetsp:Transcript_16928/g.41967  ORF Transcript_16928/g.41967 Transcript_16928/m.41967 type:complete len:268 (-) Transcript_16928:458-1261(-)